MFGLRAFDCDVTPQVKSEMPSNLKQFKLHCTKKMKFSIKDFFNKCD